MIVRVHLICCHAGFSQHWFRAGHERRSDRAECEERAGAECVGGGNRDEQADGARISREARNRRPCRRNIHNLKHWQRMLQCSCTSCTLLEHS